MVISADAKVFCDELRSRSELISIALVFRLEVKVKKTHRFQFAVYG